MQDQFREGDWVRHRSFPEPIRVIGIGTTIAVELPKEGMRAFEPCELEKVLITSVPVRKVRLHERRRNGLGAEQFALIRCEFDLLGNAGARRDCRCGTHVTLGAPLCSGHLHLGGYSANPHTRELQMLADKYRPTQY
jgi:hypothetical protein